MCICYVSLLAFLDLPLNPIMHFWLYCTVHCAKKIVSARLGAGSASTEWIGWSGVTHRVLCTWHPLTWL